MSARIEDDALARLMKRAGYALVIEARRTDGAPLDERDRTTVRALIVGWAVDQDEAAQRAEKATS